MQVLSCVLSRLVAANDPVADPGPVTKFHALRPPAITILDYCARIHKYASCSPECFVLALVYIDRLIQRNSLLLTSLNVHRIIITAIMLAAKFFDDQYFNNAYYAKVGGVPTSEVRAGRRRAAIARHPLPSTAACASATASARITIIMLSPPPES